MLSQIPSDEAAGFGKTDVKFLVQKKPIILPGGTKLLWSKSSEDVQRPDHCRSVTNWSSIVPEKECAKSLRCSEVHAPPAAVYAGCTICPAIRLHAENRAIGVQRKRCGRGRVDGSTCHNPPNLMVSTMMTRLCFILLH